MSGGKRLSQRIATMKKERERNTRPKAKTLEPAGTGAMRRHSQENIDVLYAIESTFVRCWEQDDRVDDRVILSVLRALILEDPPASMPHAWVFSELLAARAACNSVDEDTWAECLRVVKDSVERHSTREPGDCSYLVFIKPGVTGGIG